MRISARAALSLIGFAFSIGGPFAIQSAKAADSDSVASAEALFEQARELMASGKYKEACPKLALSQRLDAGVGTLLNLADCYEKNGQIASAWTTFIEAADAARDSHQSDRETIARDRAAILRPKFATLMLVPDATDHDGLEVKRDGVVVGEGLWGVAVPVDAGPHTIQASAAGKATWITTVVIDAKPGENALAIPRLKTVPTQSYGRYVGAAIAGVGIVGIAIGAVYGATAVQRKSASSEHCGDGDLCDETGVDLRSQGLTAARVSTVAFVAGGALLAGGVALFVLTPAHAPASASLSVGLASVALGG